MKFQTFKKFLSVFLIILLLLLAINSTSKGKNIDNLAYVVAIGLDTSETNNLKLSLQISKPTQGSESGSSQGSNSLINSVDCSSISSGINLFNSYISKEISLSHCKVIVISEELAKQGISTYLYTLVNNMQISSDCNIIISKCDSLSFLEHSKPTVEQLLSRYYEIAPTSSLYTGYTQDITLATFFASYVDSFKQPCAILGSINTKETQDLSSAKKITSNDANPEISSSNYANDNKDSNYTAGDTPIQSESNIENMGLAIFYGDKLVGELNGIETLCHMIISNNMETSEIQITSPVNSEDKIDLELNQIMKPQISLKLVNNAPYISINIKVNARLLSMTENSDLSADENVKKVENAINKYLEENILKYLYKTSTQYNSDIEGFGKYTVCYFNTWDEWEKYDWLYQYRNSFFSVNVDSSIKFAY